MPENCLKIGSCNTPTEKSYQLSDMKTMWQKKNENNETISILA